MSKKLVAHPLLLVEASLSILAFALAMVTLFRRDWIEVVFHVDPDHHSGALEWVIIGSLLAISLMNSFLVRGYWRKRHAVPTSSA